MSPLNRHESWTAVALDALWYLRPLLGAGIALILWLAVVVPAQADPFPFPPPNTGCPPNTTCVPSGPGPGNPGQCTPNPNGNPGCNGAGNPVDIITGNKYQHEIDLAPLPGEMALHFSRHYNSNSTHRGLTGVGWRSSFEVVLVDLGSAVQIIDADGRRLTFDRHSSQPSLCVGARPNDGRVIVDEGARESTVRRAPSAATNSRVLTYRWQRLDGSEYVFSGGSGDGHPLQSIRAASGATMTLTYLGGALDNVRDAQGRTLRFIYARPVAAGSTRHRMLTLSAIDTPVGRVTYRHDEFGRLQAAIQPNGLVHRYHYEPERQGASHNTYALTGVSVEWLQDGKISTERLATYAYDAQGRAVRTQHAGADDLTLAYGPKAATTITTAVGARTVYRHALVAGQWKTVEAIGPGCATCPPANVRYRYRIDGPQAGQLEATLRLDEQGKPLQQERVTFDAWGRPARVERISYASDRASKQPQKPELVLRARYEAMPQNLQSAELSAAQYAALWQPTLIARPSVVPGREHTVAFTYNAHLQPLTTTEAGASPIDAEGNFATTTLSRTTTYRYAPVAGVSRLTAIDGPLPGRTDTKTFHYDEQGKLRLVQHPVSDMQERFAYDDAGRVVWHTPIDAIETRTAYPGTADSLASNPLLPVSVTRAGRNSTYRYNVRGWLVRWSDGPYKAIELAYDRNGRVIEAKDAEGWRVAVNKDEANQLEATLWYAPGSAEPLRGWYRWFDASGRTTRTLTPDGRTDEFSYDPQGHLSEHIDGNGIAHFYRRSSDGKHRARIDWAPDDQIRVNVWRAAASQALVGGGSSAAQATSNAGAPRSLQDDFGRTVRVDLPDHGARTARYDAADRFEQIRFVDGATVTYEHDAAARLTMKLVREPDGVESQRVQLRYHGAYLIEVKDDVQKTAYRYDSAGRRIETSVTLVAQQQRTYATGIVLDANGDVALKRLADGRSLLIRRDELGRAQSILLQQGGLRNDKTLLSGIESQALNGVTRYAHGNGVVTARTHDTAGRLTSLRVDGVVDLTYEYDAGSKIRAIGGGVGVAGSKPAPATLTYDGYGALKTAALASSITIAANPTLELNAARQTILQTGAPALSADSATPTRDARGRLIADQHFNYRYNALDRLIAVQERESGRLIARYAYNAFGERASKTVIDVDGTESTRYFLYQRQRLAAEIDAKGAIERQYLYMNGTPVAAIDRDRVLAIHADHRGAPVAMTDEQRRIVWKATYTDPWGQVQSVEATQAGTPAWKQQLHRVSFGRAGELSHSTTRLLLRLPGQYEDEETGLHYNVHRYYDPRSAPSTPHHDASRPAVAVSGQGRYLTPDPLGYPDGPNAYLYASGDPINKIDPLGLYEEDVHYYLTYFLALVAGLTEQQAWVIASANRYIDDNPYTEPFGTALLNFNARSLYHFTYDGRDPAPLPGDVTVVPGYWTVGPLGLEWVPARTVYSASYIDRRMRNPVNGQLTALRGYAVNAPTPCAKAQFYGEYLHAYMDTFSHRNWNNVPHTSFAGHALDGHSPDKTYNHDIWQVNETRTIAMEQSVFLAFQRDFGRQGVDRDGFPITWSDIQETLEDFNRDQSQPDANGRFSTTSSKILLLDDKLDKLGLPRMAVYDRDLANRCRIANLRDANGRPLYSRQYPRAILATENDRAFRDSRCTRS